MVEGVAIESRARKWRKMTDEELAAHAKTFITGMGITARNELVKADPGLYEALRRRKLLDDIGLPDLRGETRDWAKMDRDELVAHAKKFIAEKGIQGRGELNKAASGLYQSLWKRKLLDDIGLPDSNGGDRDWEGRGREVLVVYAKGFIAQRGLTGREELKKADPGLYQALRKRKLLDEVGLPDSNKKSRDWADMGREELIDHAKGFIAQKGLAARTELKKADPGLYEILRKRKLLDEVGLPDSNGGDRDWKGRGREVLVVYAKGFIAQRGLTGREELKKADSGLYQALRKRKLLDATFSDTESSKQAKAVDSVLEALGSFGDEE